MIYIQNIHAAGVRPIPATPLSLATIPKTQGLYIVGVLIDDVFCPLYNGIGNLYDRINHHKIIIGAGYLNTDKELFDLTKPIEMVYSDIRFWELFWHRLYGIARTPAAKCHLYYQIKHFGNNSMIWFSSGDFFDSYLGLPPGTSSVGAAPGTRTHGYSLIIDLPALGLLSGMGAKVGTLINDINNTKNIICNQFYYCYCEQNTIEDNIKALPLANLEARTKWCLYSKLRTPTYANMTGAGRPVWNALIRTIPLPHIVFNFTNVPNIRNPDGIALGAIIA